MESSRLKISILHFQNPRIAPLISSASLGLRLRALQCIKRLRYDGRSSRSEEFGRI